MLWWKSMVLEAAYSPPPSCAEFPTKVEFPTSRSVISQASMAPPDVVATLSCKTRFW